MPTGKRWRNKGKHLLQTQTDNWRRIHTCSNSNKALLILTMYVFWDGILKARWWGKINRKCFAVSIVSHHCNQRLASIIVSIATTTTSHSRFFLSVFVHIVQIVFLCSNVCFVHWHKTMRKKAAAGKWIEIFQLE